MGPCSGTVIAFDRTVGLGEISSGEATFPFHATSIASGSRNIAIGTAVTFAILHASGGRREASRITERLST